MSKIFFEVFEGIPRTLNQKKTLGPEAKAAGYFSAYVFLWLRV